MQAQTTPIPIDRPPRRRLVVGLEHASDERLLALMARYDAIVADRYVPATLRAYGRAIMGEIAGEQRRRLSGRGAA